MVVRLDPRIFLSRFRNLAGATQKIKINKIENQVAEAAISKKTDDINPTYNLHQT